MSEAISFSGKSRTERLEILDSLRPGTPLYMPGHAMMYLGKFQQNITYYMMLQRSIGKKTMES